MQKLINQIFIESDFKERNINNKDIRFYLNNKSEYFLIADYSIREINDFFSNKKTNEIIDLFENMKKDILDIKKNTSLILCVKVNNLEKDIKKLKNKIFKIEEDEYYFKKYILFYTDSSLKKIDFSSNLISQLQEKLIENN